MSKTYPFNLPVIQLEHLSETNISLNANESNAPLLGFDASSYARAFARKLSEKILKNGRYVELLNYRLWSEPEVFSLSINIELSEKRFDQDEHLIHLPVVKWRFEDGSELFFSPTNAVGFYSETEDEGADGIEKVIQLSLKKDKRLGSYRQLIPLQWYNSCEASNQIIDIDIYTPSELDAIKSEKSEKYLPKLAKRMSRSSLRYFNLDNYLNELRRNLDGDFRQSVLIVGPSGCGKSALMQAYEQKVGRQWNKKPWVTSAPRTIQSLTENGSWQFNLGSVVKELRESGDVLYIGNLTEWFEVGQYSGNSVSVAEALRDPLQRNEILLVAELTPEQLQKIELRSPGYSQLFHCIEFSEKNIDEENQVAVKATQDLAKLYKVAIPEQVILKILYLQRRYSPYSGYPGKTIRFFEALILHSHKDTQTIHEQDAINSFCEESGMPEWLVNQEQSFSHDRAKSFFQQQIIGQEQAVDELIDAIMTTKAGLSRSGKPIISLLFVGPTGVGKTQTAKALSEYIFGDANRMLRFDMSEYSEPEAVLRMTSTSESSLVTKVRQNPFCVLLFDEIEKSAYNFYDLLLQILGEGRLTDDRGDVGNFCSTIIIMTSNIGAQDFMRPGMGFQSVDDNAVSHFEEKVTGYFRPELINRLDRIVPFYPLSEQDKTHILKKEALSLLELRGISNRKIKIDIAPELWQFLNALPIDYRYGTRALQRILQEHVVWPLAEFLASKPESEPMEIRLSVDDDNKMLIDAKTLSGVKQSINTFIELADQISAHRRVVASVKESSVWIGLLSSLDKLEQYKRRKSKSYWQDTLRVQTHEKLTGFCSEYEELLGDVVELERNCLSQIHESSVELLSEDFKKQLKDNATGFEKFMFTVDEYTNPELSHLHLSIYGSPSRLSYFTDKYQAYCGKFGFSHRSYWVYLVKNSMSHEELARSLSASKEEADINKKEFVEVNPEYSYWVSLGKRKNDYLQLMGCIIEIKGCCAQHYFSKENGFFELTEEGQRHRFCLQLHDQAISDITVPDGIHRKEFFRNTKPTRFYEDDVYKDKRFETRSGEELFIEAHPERMYRFAVDTLISRLVRQVQIKRERKEGGR